MTKQTQARESAGIQLVVFDWAGTTVDYGCQAPTAAFVEGFRQKGITVSMAQAREPMGMEKRAHIEAICQMGEIATAWEQKYGALPTDGDIDEMYAAFVPMLLKILESHSTLIPGVVAVVDELRRQGIKIGASTGYFTEAADIVARCVADKGYVPDASICASDVPAGRPAPWMIYRIMEMLNVYPPAAVVSVGDTTVDVESGRNAGVWSIGVAATGNEMGLTYEEFSALDTDERIERVEQARARLFASGAHWVVDTMDALPAVIAQIDQLLKQGISPN